MLTRTGLRLLPILALLGTTHGYAAAAEPQLTPNFQLSAGSYVVTVTLHTEMTLDGISPTTEPSLGGFVKRPETTVVMMELQAEPPDERREQQVHVLYRR